MADYVTLLGAEQVQNAGRAMREAADSMIRSAAEFDASLRRHEQFLEDWLTRFESAIAKADGR